MFAELYDEVMTVTVQLAPWLLLGSIIAGLLHVFVPAELIRKQFRGVGGVFKAVAFGVPMPLCSCGVIPAGVGMKEDGASDSSVIGFLISTPQTGVDSIAVAASFLGLPFAIFKVVSAAITGIVGGLITEASTADTPIISKPPTPKRSDQPATMAGALGDIFVHANMVLYTIWRWIVFGIIASALISHFVPPDTLARGLIGNPLFASLAVLVVAVPLYVCATGSVPIAAALVQAGLPMGAALVFLMAGPATNVATIGAVYKTLGIKNLIIYLGTIIFFSVSLSLGFEAMFQSQSVVINPHIDHLGFLDIASGAILTLLLMRFGYQDMAAFVRRRLLVNSENENTKTFAVAGMTCGGCAKRLQGVLLKQNLVEMADVSFERGNAIVTGAIEHETIIAAIAEAGFEVVGEEFEPQAG